MVPHLPEWVEVARGDEVPGDVGIFWITNRRDPSHVGLVLGGHQMLTTMRGPGVVVEDYREDFWRTRWAGFARHPRVQS